jgi:hypothetical protein
MFNTLWVLLLLGLDLGLDFLSVTTHTFGNLLIVAAMLT